MTVYKINISLTTIDLNPKMVPSETEVSFIPLRIAEKVIELIADDKDRHRQGLRSNKIDFQFVKSFEVENIKKVYNTDQI